MYKVIQKKALIFLTNKSSETEFVIVVEVLRRGNVDVIVAGLPDKSPIKCRHEVTIIPDISISQVTSRSPFDAIILPGGGEGANTFAKSQEIGNLLKEEERNGCIIAAICAAPIALKAHGIGLGKNVTSHPSKKAVMMEGGNYIYKEDHVVVDGTLITSRGPGTSMQFALNILEQLAGKEKAREVAKAMLL